MFTFRAHTISMHIAPYFFIFLASYAKFIFLFHFVLAERAIGWDVFRNITTVTIKMFPNIASPETFIYKFPI